MEEKDIRRLAAEAQVDPRSVRKVLGGGTVKTLTDARIKAAAKKLRLKLK